MSYFTDNLALLRPKVSRAAVWLGELSWDQRSAELLFDWASSRHASPVDICQLLLKLFLFCQVTLDFDEAWYEWYEDKVLQSYRADFEYLHKLL